MKTENNILLAFILNLSFAVLEFFGGIFIGSVAILSDAIHDLGDAVSIGISYFLERKSHKKPDDKYTCGYARFSVMGSVVTTLILLFGSILVIIGAVQRIISPTPIAYDGMILFAIFGVIMNLAAAIITRGKGSLNQRAVNLHMLEDVLGWVVVLVGAVVMRFSNFALLDPIMSMGVALFILFHAVRNLKEAIDLFLERVPHGIRVSDIKAHVEAVEGVMDAHHIHVWSMDGQSHYATLHIKVAEGSDTRHIKEVVRAELAAYGIIHVTLELEAPTENCHCVECDLTLATTLGHHHGHCHCHGHGHEHGHHRHHH